MRLCIGRTTRLAGQVSVASGVALALLMFGAVASHLSAGSLDTGVEPSRESPGKPGLSINDPRAFRGYTLLAPMTSTKTYLIDMQGRVVRTWESDTTPAHSAYLLENGHLLRPGALAGEQQTLGGGPGAGGRVQEFTWDGQLVWDFKFSTDRLLPHHDLAALPNGNVLLIVWEKKTVKEAVAAGRKPELVRDGRLLPDALIEVKPTGKATGKVVWEWHVWDHLIQDHNPSKANHGDVAAHPELIDVNFVEGFLAPLLAKKEGVDKLRSIGYLGSSTGKRPPRIDPDWTHTNAVAYNAELDQIVLSVHGFSEIWVLDHSTTTAESAGHTGGRGGKGGDLLYRWGNPRTYRAGTVADQRLFAPHDAHWIPRGLPGEGHLLVFNNGIHRPGGDSSSVDEIVPPVGADGRYLRESGTAYGPEKPIWSYAPPKKTDFYSMLISGANRLKNGNTLICSGMSGTIFEVTPEKEVVWRYTNPVKSTPAPAPARSGPPGPRVGPPGFGGPGAFGAPPRPGQILPPFVQDLLKMTPEQKEQLEQLQRQAEGNLNLILKEEQRKQLETMRDGGPGGPGGPGEFGGPPRPGQALAPFLKGLLKMRKGLGPGGPGGPEGPPRPGQMMPPFIQDELKMSAEQKKELEELQKDVDGKLDQILKGVQRTQIMEMRESFDRGGPGGPGGRPRPGLILPPFLQEALKMNPVQKTKLDELQKRADAKLEETLTDAQNKQLKNFRETLGPRMPGGSGGPPRPGQIMPPFMQDLLKMTPEQKEKLEEFQKVSDARLDTILADEQKQQIQGMREDFDRSRSGGSPADGFGLVGGNSVFRAYRYAPDYPGLAGKDLKPGTTLEEPRSNDGEKK